MNSTLTITGLLLMMMFTSACVTQKRYADPLATMTDRMASHGVRRVAAQQAYNELGFSPAHVKALHRLVWDRGYPHAQRKYAIDRLIEHDEAAFHEILQRRIVLLHNWDTLNYVFDWGVKRQWPNFIRTVVRSYARAAHGMRDDERSEHTTIERINPDKTVQQSVFEVFADPDDSVSHKQQVAAWTLLSRISTQDELLRMISAAPATTPLAVDLKAAATELSVLPRNREGVLWLAYLRGAEQAGFWQSAAAQLPRLSPAQRRGMQLRHLPVLLAMGDDAMSRTRAAMFASVDTMVSPSEHHYKGATYDGAPADYPQRLAHWRDELTWPDLAVMWILCKALRDRDVVASLFAQAGRDLTDTSTEHGGIIDVHNGRFLAIAYPPFMRTSDRKFIPSDKMVRHMYTALAHYHFHAQEQRNSDYAGPGRGDRKLANRLNPNCVVFTFIDANRLNVDYYQPGGAVIDLGTVYR